MNPPPESEHPEPPDAALSEDGLYPPAGLAYPAPAGEAYDPATAGFEYAAPSKGEPPAAPAYDYDAPYEEEQTPPAAPEYAYAAPYEGELTTATPPEYEYAAPAEADLALAPPPAYEYLAPVEDGHAPPLAPEHPAPSAAEPFPVLEPATATLPATAAPAAYEAGYVLPPAVSAPTQDESKYAPRPASAGTPPQPASPAPSVRRPPPNVPDDQVALLCEGLERFLGAAEARVHVLRGVSLRLEPGFVHAVVGPSGCGKSSLLYILGLLDRPDAGRLVISGRPVANLADDDLSRQRSALLGFIFQFHFLLQDFSAQENIMIPMRQLGMLSEPQMRERSAYLLDAVGLGDKGHRASRHLSGGEQQRVAIARALANDPQVILADEPTGNLDTANSTRVFSLLTDLVHRENKALLLVTHNPAIAEACDWVHTMRDGLIVDQQFVGMQR